jgi:hypothetical protein
MAMAFAYVPISSAQGLTVRTTQLMADTTNPYGGTDIDPLPATATIFTVANGKKSINYSKNDLLKIRSTII